MGARDRLAYIRGLLDAGGAPEGISAALCGAVVEALCFVRSQKTRCGDKQRGNSGKAQKQRRKAQDNAVNRHGIVQPQFTEYRHGYGSADERYEK